eukprot:Unigene5051_Nuclearia_a/m.15497 Unigene5051_Nuclearia_a/g.15497  ORF Unigene5051_Nuclearia_a/g.15497 Unigene5051_Nuclearia_a/m.15497 type:complete len:650 (-) Unigene5051_Nuclearia_a:1806-3755(-)
MHQTLAERVQELAVEQRFVLGERLQQLVDLVSLEQRTELLERLLRGLAHARVGVVQVQQHRDHVGLDLLVEHGLARALAETAERAKQRDRARADLGVGRLKVAAQLEADVDQDSDDVVRVDHGHNLGQAVERGLGHLGRCRRVLHAVHERREDRCAVLVDLGVARLGHVGQALEHEQFHRLHRVAHAEDERVDHERKQIRLVLAVPDELGKERRDGDALRVKVGVHERRQEHDRVLHKLAVVVKHEPAQLHQRVVKVGLAEPLVVLVLVEEREHFFVLDAREQVLERRYGVLVAVAPVRVGLLDPVCRADAEQQRAHHRREHRAHNFLHLGHHKHLAQRTRHRHCRLGRLLRVVLLVALRLLDVRLRGRKKVEVVLVEQRADLGVRGERLERLDGLVVVRQRHLQELVGDEHEVVAGERAQRVQRAVERLLVRDALERRVDARDDIRHLPSELAAAQAQDAVENDARAARACHLLVGEPLQQHLHEREQLAACELRRQRLAQLVDDAKLRVRVGHGDTLADHSHLLRQRLRDGREHALDHQQLACARHGERADVLLRVGAARDDRGDPAHQVDVVHVLLLLALVRAGRVDEALQDDAEQIERAQALDWVRVADVGRVVLEQAVEDGAVALLLKQRLHNQLEAADHRVGR